MSEGYRGGGLGEIGVKGVATVLVIWWSSSKSPESRSLSSDALESGRWVSVCNIEGHW